METLSRAEEEREGKMEKEERSDREKREQPRKGVSRLTGSPSVLGLPPPSVYRCPAETEGTTELHTPPSSSRLSPPLETSRPHGRTLVLGLAQPFS